MSNLRDLKRPTSALTPIAEPNEPHPGTLSPFKQPVLPAVAAKAPTALSQGAVAPASGNLAEIAQDPITE